MPKSFQNIALVHDFLREYGGAERVLEALHQIFPDAPVYTAFVDQRALGKHWQRFASWDIRSTWFAKLPFHKKLYSPLRFLAPHAFASLDLSQYDIVISSSNAFEAKAVLSKRSELGKRPPCHICYCHTPPRALYGYSTMSAWKKNPVIHFFGNLINHYMRIIDFQVAQKVDLFLANSEETAKRIGKFYRRQSQVVYPPVAVEQIAKLAGKPQPLVKRQYYFYINRLGLQKHPEMAVAVCNKLNLPLKIAGAGQMLEQLKAMAGPNIEFVGVPNDQQLAKLYAGAKALLYPVEDEDFGIIPIEAMSAGTPVIAHNSGGPSQTVIGVGEVSKNGVGVGSKSFVPDQDYRFCNRQAPNFCDDKKTSDIANSTEKSQEFAGSGNQLAKSPTGILFNDLSANGLEKAVLQFEKQLNKFSPTAIQQYAQKFSQQKFELAIREVVEKDRKKDNLGS